MRYKAKSAPGYLSRLGQLDARVVVQQQKSLGENSPAVGTFSFAPRDYDVLEYRGLKLDPFQTDAIRHIEAGRSVLVSAPTGVGKTLVADYLIERMFNLGQRVIYTAPIKALSNQKFKEFKRLLGSDNVGIITGDVVINSGAQILIMTTEIFRNMLHLSPRELDGVSHVIFDEIHYLGDEDRGTVWEESIIFMPDSMRLLGLSATIPNADELAFWMRDIKGHEIEVVRHTHRVVPLRHHVFEKTRGECSLAELKEFKRIRDKEIEEASAKGEWNRDISARYKTTTHLDLVDYLGKQGKLPCLYFVFSRRQCEDKAEELAMAANYLTKTESRDVLALFDERVSALNLETMPSVRKMRKAVQRGIAYHHAGLLPVLKEIVEELFESRLVHVLYATETFAVGINYPVRSVCFDSVRKFNGVDFRPMTSQEYFQMAGRAGRRGIDPEGHVYVLVDLNFFRPEEFPRTDEDAVEPLQSRFGLSYNTVLNLMATRSSEEITKVLRQNFASYQANLGRKSIEADLARARVLDESVSFEACKDMGKGECPMVRDELKAELAAIRGRLKKSRGKRNRDKREKLRLEMEALKERISSLSVRKCDRGMKKQCRRLMQRKAAVADRIRGLYGQMRRLGSEERFVYEFKRKQALLERLGYMEGANLLGRGEVAREIHTQELLVTELIFAGIFHEFDVAQIASLAVCVDYEPRRGEFPARSVPFDVDKVREIATAISLVEESYLGSSEIRFFTGLAPLAYRWSQGAEFTDLMRGSTYAEGDVVSAFRRGIDLLRQVRAACKHDEALTAKLTDAIKSLDRDVVEVVL